MICKECEKNIKRDDEGMAMCQQCYNNFCNGHLEDCPICFENFCVSCIQDHLDIEHKINEAIGAFRQEIDRSNLSNLTKVLILSKLTRSWFINDM